MTAVCFPGIYTVHHTATAVQVCRSWAGLSCLDVVCIAWDVVPLADPDERLLVVECLSRPQPRRIKEDEAVLRNEHTAAAHQAQNAASSQPTLRSKVQCPSMHWERIYHVPFWQSTWHWSQGGMLCQPWGKYLV